MFGNDYVYAGAGQGFSAAVKRDGSLLTWGGGGYNNELGDGAEGRLRPAAIGQGFVSADVDNYGGRALKRDGTLYAWGSSWPTLFQVVAHDVAQVSGSNPILVLHRDGQLKAWNESGWPHARRDALNWHGTGFVRIPKNQRLSLGWRADGTAWAWAHTLRAMVTHDDLPGLGESPWPRLVGRGWVDVRMGDGSVAARKADGSLWVSRWRGQKVRMEPLGCGFADMAFAHDKKYGKHLLALRSDGRLLDYHGDALDVPNPRREIFDRKPDLLLAGGVRLFDEADYWGDIQSKVFLLRKDGTLWQWYSCIESQGCFDPDKGSKRRMIKMDLPQAWFNKVRPVANDTQPIALPVLRGKKKP